MTRSQPVWRHNRDRNQHMAIVQGHIVPWDEIGRIVGIFRYILHTYIFSFQDIYLNLMYAFPKLVLIKCSDSKLIHPAKIPDGYSKGKKK